MSNDLVLSEEMSYEQIAALTGQAVVNALLPSLKINNKASVTIDGKKHRLDPGVFCVDKDGKTIYAQENEPVRFRVLFQGYQYLRYDEHAINKNGGKGAMINKSAIRTDCKRKTEFPDELGTDRCAKVRVEEGETVSAEQEKINKQTSLYRQLYGLVSFTGKTATGEVVEITDYPVMLKRRGKDFMTFGDEVEKPFGKMKANFLEYELRLSTEERENGTTIYYLVHYAFDRTAKLRLTMEIAEAVKKFREHVEEENRRVMEKHVKALNGELPEPDMDTMRDIDADDMDQDIPF